MAGLRKQFERRQHTEIHLSGLKAQYKAKIESFLDKATFQLPVFPSSCAYL